LIAAEQLPDVSDRSAEELRTRFRQLPAQLHTSGLAATYAFLAARSGTASSQELRDAYGRVAELIRGHLAELELVPGGLSSTPVPAAHQDMFTALGQMDTVDYARASAEVARLFGWLRRIAEAVYADRSGGGQDDGEGRT